LALGDIEQMPALNQMKLWRSSILVDTALQIKLAGIGQRRLELESGAGDGNRTHPGCASGAEKQALWRNAIHAATAIGASGSSDPLFAAAAYANPATCRGEILDASKKSLETPNHIFTSTTGSGLVHKSEVLSKILDYERAVPGKFRRQFNRDAPHEYIFLALG
jgi:hypothetical protein